MSLMLDAPMTPADHGDRAAADALFDTLYSELHRLARRELAQAGAGSAVSASRPFCTKPT